MSRRSEFQQPCSRPDRTSIGRRALRLFGLNRLSEALARAVVVGVAPLRVDLADHMAALRQEMRELHGEVRSMATQEEQVLAKVALIKSEIATMGQNYNAAIAAQLAVQLAAAKAAWEADNEAEWNATMAAITDLQTAAEKSLPVTPPVTDANPNPTPVTPPATDGSTATPSHPDTTPAATPAPADTTAPPATGAGAGTGAQGSQAASA